MWTSGCVYDEIWWYVSSAPVDSHLVPPPPVHTLTDTQALWLHVVTEERCHILLSLLH